VPIAHEKDALGDPPRRRRGPSRSFAPRSAARSREAAARGAGAIALARLSGASRNGSTRPARFATASGNLSSRARGGAYKGGRDRRGSSRSSCTAATMVFHLRPREKEPKTLTFSRAQRAPSPLNESRAADTYSRRVEITTPQESAAFGARNTRAARRSQRAGEWSRTITSSTTR